MPSADREREFVQGSAEPFQEQRAPRFVVPKQPHAAHTIGQAQHREQRPSATPTRLGSTYTGRATMPPSGT